LSARYIASNRNWPKNDKPPETSNVNSPQRKKLKTSAPLR